MLWLKAHRRAAIALAALCAAAIAVAVATIDRQKPPPANSLFSWEAQALTPQERPRLLKTLELLGARALYQAFPGQPGEEAREFLRAMGRERIAVYALVGEAAWGLERDGASLRAAIGDLSALGAGEGGLAGVVVDVEPYLTDIWEEDKEGVMGRYVDSIRAAYLEAQKAGLEMIVCIPYWYETVSVDLLELLIAQGCDSVAIMNYNRRDEAAHIETEVAFARAWGKGAINIAEFQRPGRHELTAQNTYYQDGVQAARESWQGLSRQLNYPRLSFSYHCYAPLRGLLGLGDEAMPGGPSLS